MSGIDERVEWLKADNKGQIYGKKQSVAALNILVIEYVYTLGILNVVSI